jgi:hypothetical protein
MSIIGSFISSFHSSKVQETAYEASRILSGNGGGGWSATVAGAAGHSRRGAQSRCWRDCCLRLLLKSFPSAGKNLMFTFAILSQSLLYLICTIKINFFPSLIACFLFLSPTLTFRLHFRCSIQSCETMPQRNEDKQLHQCSGLVWSLLELRVLALTRISSPHSFKLASTTSGSFAWRLVGRYDPAWHCPPSQKICGHFSMPAIPPAFNHFTGAELQYRYGRPMQMNAKKNMCV